MKTNNSGIRVVGDRILIYPEPLEEMSSGGIYIAEDIRDQHGLAQVFGTLVGVGPDCWSDYKGPFAEEGQRVMFAKYGGLNVTGADGETYRLCNDTDITAVVDESVKYGELSARKRINE